jgi:hypothetical protein
MRVAGQWALNREYGDATAPDWVGVGYTVADLGAVLLIATIVLAGVVARRRTAPGRASLAAAIVGGVLLLAYLVAVWAMTTKPG